MAIVDVAAAKVVLEAKLNGRPSGLAWSRDGGRLFAAERGASTVAEIDPGTGQVVRRLPAGLRPIGLALVPERNLLLAANSESDSVSLIDLGSGKEKARVGVCREPFFLVVTPGGSLAVCGNALPQGKSSEPEHAAALSLIDLEKAERVADIRLPPGSTNVRELAVSADGRWAYAVHTLGRTQLPTTQLERGWVNTNALSAIDLGARAHYATVLLDHPMEGAPNPWGLVLSKDGKRLWVSISGAREVARIDLATLHLFMDGKLPGDHRLAQAANYPPGTESIWLRIKIDPKQRSELVNDLASLYGAGLIQKFKIEGREPRGIDLSPDGKILAAAAYFSGRVDLLDAESGRTKGSIPLGPDREPDPVRLGESIFYDATYCFQHWMSCSTCHFEGRVDAMNWDLLNDGIGNPKNTHSLLWSFQTPPAMSQGVRESMEAAVRAGFIHILFHQPEEKTLQATEAYLKAMEPEPSPFKLPGGGLSEAAKRGEALFASPRTECSKCHPAPLFTDMKMYDVGTRGSLDRTAEFDNPSLIELYRTAPYLHDGSAATLRVVLVERNVKDLHGKTSGLSPQEIDDLVAYMLSL